MPGAHVAERMGDFPDAILIGDQDFPIAPSEAIGLIETFGVPLDEFRFALGVGAQQRQMSGLLLGDDHVAIGQNKQAPRMLELGK